MVSQCVNLLFILIHSKKIKKFKQSRSNPIFFYLDLKLHLYIQSSFVNDKITYCTSIFDTIFTLIN